MADRPLAALGGKTPIEACETPAMDEIARRGASGTFKTLPDGLPTSSDVANMSVLGLDPLHNYPGRGPIEAVSQGIPLDGECVAWRCNLVTVSYPDAVLRDYSAGHIAPAEAKRLIGILQRELGSGKAEFHSGVSYRNLLVLRGPEFASEINYFKPDSSQDIPVAELPLTPAADTEKVRRTIDFVNRLRDRAGEILRAEGGPATDIWPWSPGRAPRLPRFSDLFAGRRGAVISAVDVIKGIGKCAGMEVIDVPGATGYLDTDYAGKVEAALKALERNDLVYLHVEAIDECSHQGSLELKMRALRDFDSRIVAPVLKALAGRDDVRFAVLPDHPVPLELRIHTTEPVPVAVCGPGIRPDGLAAYGESLAPGGALGAMQGAELMRLVMGLDEK